ncbi:dihydroxyacetone kinase subunit DhaL [Flexivirga meconopsidis]|uniref:dihydroxyacetone kinase subunit DhaL n=1 Tax=Flexivirga meconopsidis TaxID=2977121 RepID=UPI00223FD48E|nr:dihydroxyacetone kinase subunit DhaL [Flexivirga meconopsidis]
MADAWDVPLLTQWLTGFRDAVDQAGEELTALDSAIGDADHGSNMQRGLAAAVSAVTDAPPADCGAFFKTVGMSLVSNVGGASGPLYGTLFLRMGTVAGTAETLAIQLFGECLQAGLDGLVQRGKAQAGDKTMVDAMLPAVRAYDEVAADGGPMVSALTAAAQAAAQGRDGTTPMEAKKGRASYLGERSVGHQDPGATSMTLLFETAAKVFA